MKTVLIEQTNLDSCVNEAQREHVIVTRQGKPTALVTGIDEEQLDLGNNDSFLEANGGKTYPRHCQSRGIRKVD